MVSALRSDPYSTIGSNCLIIWRGYRINSSYSCRCVHHVMRLRRSLLLLKSLTTSHIILSLLLYLLLLHRRPYIILWAYRLRVLSVRNTSSLWCIFWLLLSAFGIIILLIGWWDIDLIILNTACIVVMLLLNLDLLWSWSWSLYSSLIDLFFLTACARTI